MGDGRLANFVFTESNCFHLFSRMRRIRVQIRFAVSAVNEFLAMGPRNTKLQSYQDGDIFDTDLYSAYTESESYVTGYHNKGLHLFFFFSLPRGVSGKNFEVGHDLLFKILMYFSIFGFPSLLAATKM